jgi:hypothetical protein
MNTYNWVIEALDCKVNEGNLQDVVYTVHWRYRATNENDITAETYGAQAVLPPSEEDFTPYNELTKEQVVGWLEASMDVSSMDLYLDNQIELIVNPVDVTPPLPFVN